MKKTLIALCSIFLLLSGQALAAYPDRPITFIIPYPPGGNADIALRVLAEAVEQELGTKIVTTPMPGSGSLVGINKALNSPADGYTIFMAAQTVLTITTQVRKLRFTHDTPEIIATVAEPTLYLGTRQDMDKFKTFQQFVDYAKANPGAINVSQIGLAGTHMFVGHKLMKSYNMKYQPVPFDGGPPTVSAVLGGHADAVFTDNFNPALKPLVITGSPSKHYPGVPTLAELGHPELSTSILYVICAPKGTPKEVTKKLEAAFAKAMKSPKYLEVLDSLKWTPTFLTGAETEALLNKEAKEVKEFIDQGLFKAEEK